MAESAIIAAIAKAIPGATASGVITVGAAAAAAVSSIAISSYQAKKAEADARKNGARAARDITVRSAIEPARIVYGEARTSGPVVYTNTAPTPGTSDNSTLWTVISLCQHEIEDITAIYLDGDEIPSSAIDWSGTGGVTSGTYGPIGSNQVTNFYRRFGTDTQTHVTQLATTFSDWTSDYDGKGIAYIVCAFELGTATGEGVWAQGAPQNIRAVVKGKKVYDPRLDSTQTAISGSGSHRLNDPTTWAWSDNPALCVADYLHDSRLGMGAEGISYTDIDFDMVAAAADICDATVSTPGGSEKRFTCNGALSTEETYADNIKQLLSSMGGSLTWSGGKFRIRALAYEAPTFSFTGDDIIGDVEIQPETNRTQRFNIIRGTFIDPESDYVATEFIPVENTSYKNTRDGGQSLNKQIKLPFTNSEYMAQRIAFKQLNVANQQMRLIVPMNFKAMKVAAGDRIQLSIDELSFSNKIFVVENWNFEPEGGYRLTLQEDSSSAYADPASPSEYSTRTLAGTVSFADQAVSAPSGLSATSEEVANVLSWTAPPRASGYDEIEVYASATSAWSASSAIGRTRGTTFRHELAHGTQRYYWVRAIDTDGRESIRNPDSDTSTIQATSGQIATSQLNDDASFAGAQVGTNLRDDDGSTILTGPDLKNEEITDLFGEDGNVLNLETGDPLILNTNSDNAISVRTSLDGVEANYAVKVDLNGRVSGFGLIATEATATPFSAFIVLADQFAVVDPDSSASNPIVPFSVSGNKAVFTTDVEISGDLITTGTIDASTVSVTNLQVANITGDVSERFPFWTADEAFLTATDTTFNIVEMTIPAPSGGVSKRPAFECNLNYQNRDSTAAADVSMTVSVKAESATGVELGAVAVVIDGIGEDSGAIVFKWFGVAGNQMDKLGVGGKVATNSAGSAGDKTVQGVKYDGVYTYVLIDTDADGAYSVGDTIFYSWTSFQSVGTFVSVATVFSSQGDGPGLLENSMSVSVHGPKTTTGKDFRLSFSRSTGTAQHLLTTGYAGYIR